MITTVLFDVDGVLVDSFEANLKFFQDLMVLAGKEPPSREKYSKMFHLDLANVISVLAKPESDDEFKKIYEMADNRAVSYDTDLINVPDVAEDVLKILSKKYTLGIVTGRIRNSVYEIPGLRALKDYFEVAIAYEDTDKHKPKPEPLELAMQKLGVEASQVVYIGDAQTDAEAAKAAGVRFISYPDELDGVDAHADSFSELPEIVELL